MSADASRLCRACGLCCNGVLHRTAVVEDHEAEPLRELGIPVRREGPGFGFAMPCPQHRDDHCAIYENRPRTCIYYRCELLEEHLRGEIDLDRALERVERARALVDAVRRHLGAQSATLPGEGLWRQLEAFEAEAPFPAGSPETAERWLDIASLAAFCNRHFRKPAEAKG
jgi:Fe-S-cluster containining protein